MHRASTILLLPLVVLAGLAWDGPGEHLETEVFAEEPAVTPEEPSSAEPVEPAQALPLVEADAWRPGSSGEDPLLLERPATVDCPAAAWGPELGGLEVQTGACNYFHGVQGSLEGIEPGDTVEVVVFHDRLDAAEPAEGHVAVLLGDEVVWEAHVEIPAEANVIEARWIADRSWPAGTPVGLHLHNHGYNSWSWTWCLCRTRSRPVASAGHEATRAATVSEVESRSDHELLDAWQHGDRASGAVLFDRHYASITRFFRNKVGEPSDLVQRTFLTALEAAPRFRGDSSVRTWLFGIAHRVLLRYFRDRRGPRATAPLPSASVEDLGESPCGAVVRRDEERLLLLALRRLPLEHQAMLELHYWEQLKVSEVAKVFGMPEGTVKVKMFRARKRLHELLETMEASEQARHSTVTRLDEWAAGLREQLERPPPPST